MKTFATILALAGATAAMAGCPNMCSGKGDCTADDVCQCWSGYTGYDCSQRECPMVESWALNSREGAHYYSECAGAGICDRSTGSCQCFPGYEGRGCERSACPNGCSGRGTCRMIADLPNVVLGDEQDAGVTPDVGELGTAYQWDQKALTACVCDGGYMGPDCSQRICPFGDDPMTVCEQGNVEQIQQFELKITGEFDRIADGTAKGHVNVVNPDAFALRFTSFAGEEFYTSAFDITGGAVSAGAAPTDVGADAEAALATVATNLEAALQGIPNFRIGSVNVDESTGDVNVLSTADRITFTPQITFQHDNSVGNSYGAQELLKCPHPRTIATGVNTYGCGEAGCQPMIPQMRAELSLEVPHDGTGATVAHSADTYFTTDSVLTCGLEPVELPDVAYQTCTGGTGGITSQWNGALIIIAKDNMIYARHESTAGNLVMNTVADMNALATNDYSSTFPPVGGTGNYHLLGFYDDIATNNVIDVSAVMPGTKVNLVSPGATGVFEYQLYYTPATCTDAVDVTKGGAIGGTFADAPQAFDNYDVENVECSARGECDRSTGLCQCFHGYTGLNCGSQTILV